MHSNTPLSEEEITKTMNKTQLSRRDIITLNSLYKSLCQIQSLTSGIEDFLTHEGIKFETFYTLIFQVFLLGRENAEMLFRQLNETHTSRINFKEFLNCMKNLQTKTKKERISLFLKLADKDGNGLLSFEEIFHLAKNCLKNNFLFAAIDFDEDKFLIDLADYFAQLIFKICDYSKDDEIPLRRIAEVIAKGHPQEHLLVFFCGADLV